MNRRKFLIGAGSLAAGSAAAMGTGAFSSVSANRDVAVSVAGDQSAYLALDATSAYAVNDPSEDPGELALDFTGQLDEQNGNGLNTAAETAFGDVFKITNQGTNTVYVWIATNDYDAGGATSVETVAGDENDVATNLSDNSEVDISYPGGGSSGSEISSNGPSRKPGGWVKLQPGEDTSVDVNFFVNDSDPETWYKEWQINASTSEPDPADYQDSGLQGHSGDDLSTDDV